MRTRVLVLAAGMYLAATGSAAAQAPPRSTFDQAATTFPYPVWQPARTLGLHADVREDDCGYGATPALLKVSYSRPGSGRRVSIWEAHPAMCGNPGEAAPVKTVRVRGARMTVWVNCFTPACHPKVSDGVRHGYLVTGKLPARRSARSGGARHTTIQAMSVRMRLGPLLRVLRSMEVVDLQRPVVEVRSFLSSDGSVWCGIGLLTRTDRWCSTNEPHHGASVQRNGSVRLCGDAQPPPWQRCIQNWDDHAYRLADGQRSDTGGFVCTDHHGAVTCTVKGGSAAGHGFHVDRAGSAPVDGAAA
jgi:hypothetical protein